MIEARPIDRSNVNAILKLQVRDDQKHFVGSNAMTLAQAQFEPYSSVYGFWEGDVPVGLIAMIDLQPDHPDFSEDDPENAIYVWRLMIDKDHQGKGYGTQAMEFAFDWARKLGRTQLCLSVVPEDGSAIPFYERLGLRDTGRVDQGEAVFVGPVPDGKG